MNDKLNKALRSYKPSETDVNNFFLKIKNKEIDYKEQTKEINKRSDIYFNV